ncbi:hypothetical protein [Tenacibaculum xiamenense]|uniref:hypothetical protein n=1 Tax=Tenacibaculum xiamenense TaxID=1261553 RepID=UPI0038B647B0
MKNLKNLGKVLNSNEQKSILGGIGTIPKKNCEKNEPCCYSITVYYNGKWMEEVHCENEKPV